MANCTNFNADGEDDDDDVDAEDESPNASLFSKPVLDGEESTVEASDDTITEDANGNYINK